MQLGIIGVGGAGGKIVDELLQYESETGYNFVHDAVVFNTAKSDLMGLSTISKDKRILIGEKRVKGHGCGSDIQLGAQIFEDSIQEVQLELDDIPVYDVDAVLVVAGLGGGTAGGSPVIAKQIRRVYRKPVYGLGVLPSADEGGIFTLNTAKCLPTFRREVDNLLLFDNDAWIKRDSPEKEQYENINEHIAKRFGTLFRIDEINQDNNSIETTLDTSDIIDTLSKGDVSTVGYAEKEIKQSSSDGLVSRFINKEDDDDDPTADRKEVVTTLIRKSTLSNLTIPYEIGNSESVLTAFRTSNKYSNTTGIENGKKWLEKQTGSQEIVVGEYLDHDAGLISSTVLISDLEEVPRIKEIQLVAEEAEKAVSNSQTKSSTDQSNESNIGIDARNHGNKDSVEGTKNNVNGTQNESNTHEGTDTNKNGIDASKVDIENNSRTSQENETKTSNFFSNPPEMKFEDVAGMKELKKELRTRVIEPLENPDKYEKYGLSVENGFLFHGPPGTGKTYISKALAGELGINYANVKGTDLISRYVGAGAENVGELFEEARNYDPCMVFIDEIDAVATERKGSGQHQMQAQMVNQLLEEIGEINDSDRDIVVVGATNRLNKIDEAIIRSGRLSEHIEIELPDADSRIAILDTHLEAPRSPALTLNDFRSKTDGLNAADMEQIATNAAREAMLRDGKVENADIETAIQHVK